MADRSFSVVMALAAALLMMGIMSTPVTGSALQGAASSLIQRIAG